jgi:hypothetical protein
MDKCLAPVFFPSKSVSRLKKTEGKTGWEHVVDELICGARLVGLTVFRGNLKNPV